MTSSSKAKRIGEVLQILAYRDFDIYDNTISVTPYDGGPLADERQVSEEVEKQSEQHLLLHHGICSESAQAVDDWCPECTKQLFSNRFGPSSWLVHEMEALDWFKKAASKESATGMLMAVLRFLDEHHDEAMHSATKAVAAREGLTPSAENLEKTLTDWTGDADRVTDFYTERLGLKFKGIVERAERLNAISIRVPAPEPVQRYLVEASRCYIFGQYIACLAVSRAAIELALGDFLQRNGASAGLRKLQEKQQDGFSARLRVAETLPSWKLKFTLDMAREVKYWADKVLHEKDVGPEKCKELFFKARAVLRDLYI